MGGLRLAGPFRGLLPYTEADSSVFFGREGDQRALLDALQRQANEPVLVTGETGVGKTSLLRASVAQAAASCAFTSVYLEVGPYWRSQTPEALSQTLGEPVNTLDDISRVVRTKTATRGTAPLIVLDHVEQLLWLPRPALDQLLRLLANLAATPRTRLVLAVDLGYSHALGRLGQAATKMLGGPTIELQRLQRDHAAQIVEQTVLAGGGYIEAGLAELIAEDLADKGQILPAALQVVGHALMRRGASKIASYRRMGGAQTLIETYVDDLVGDFNRSLALRLLMAFIEEPNPRAYLSVATIAEHAGASTQLVEESLGRLVEAGLLAAPNPPRSYALAHPYLLPLVRDACAPLRRGRSRARRRLRTRTDGQQVLRPHELLSTARHLGTALDPREQQAVWRSRRFWTRAFLIALSVPPLLTLLLFVSNVTGSFVDVRQTHDGVRRYVVRRGRPSLSWSFRLAPTLGSLVVDSDFSMTSLNPALQRAVHQKKLAGSMLSRQASVPTWFSSAVDGLPLARKGAWLLLAGSPEGIPLLVKASSDARTMPLAAQLLVTLAHKAAQTEAVLAMCLRDPRTSLRLWVLDRAQHLAPAARQRLLAQGGHDKHADVRLAALQYAAALSQDMRPMIESGLSDPDPRLRKAGLDALSRLESSAPDQAFLLLHRLQHSRSTLTPAVAAALAKSRETLLKSALRPIVAKLARQLEHSADDSYRLAIATTLGQLSGQMDQIQLNNIATTLVSDRHLRVKAIGLGLKAHSAVDSNELEALLQLSRAYSAPRKEAQEKRYAAAGGLGYIDKAHTQRVLPVLKRLLRDPARTVRGAAVRSLMRLGWSGLNEVLSAVKNGPADLASAAVEQICRQGGDRRWVTAVLATTWHSERRAARLQALSCVNKLTRANPRLAMWLADQAITVDDRQVRLGGTAAVAAAVHRSGARLARLVRAYLRLGDNAVRVALLERVSGAIPSRPAFLFDIVMRYRNDPSAALRATLATMIGKVASRPNQAIDALLPLLRDRQAGVRLAALRALPRLVPSGKGTNDSRVEQALQAVLDPSGHRQAESIAAVRAAARLQITSVLQSAVRHPRPRVRREAVARLAESGGGPETVRRLSNAVHDADFEVQRSAVLGLALRAKVFGISAAKAIWNCAQSEDARLSELAFIALGKLQGAKVRQWVQARLETQLDHRSDLQRRRAIATIGALWRPGTKLPARVVSAIFDRSYDVRSAAREAVARHLAKHGKRERLWRKLHASRRHASVRRTMMLALAYEARANGSKWLATRLQDTAATQPFVARTATRLALTLARGPAVSLDSVVGWLYGW